MQEIFQYTYIAGGIWKEDLRSLLWARAFKQPLDSYQYFAPFWSWASSTSPISMRVGDEKQPDVKVGSRQAEPAQSEINNVGTDCYGQVRDSYIIVKAPTLNIEYHQERYAINGLPFTEIPVKSITIIVGLDPELTIFLIV
jgi:hypothetical protein